MENHADSIWSRLEIEDLASLFTSIDEPWYVAGGLAIDLFLGRSTRHHEDLDIVIDREHQPEFIDALKGWDLRATHPPGTLQALNVANGEIAPREANAIWCREDSDSPWRFEFLLSPFTKDEWIYRRIPGIRGPLEKYSWRHANGVRVIAPEIQLLYKSKSRRAKDDIDLLNCVPALNGEQKAWLKKMIQLEHGVNHPWLELI